MGKGCLFYFAIVRIRECFYEGVVLYYTLYVMVLYAGGASPQPADIVQKYAVLYLH